MHELLLANCGSSTQPLHSGMHTLRGTATHRRESNQVMSSMLTSACSSCSRCGLHLLCTRAAVVVALTVALHVPLPSTMREALLIF